MGERTDPGATLRVLRRLRRLLQARVLRRLRRLRTMWKGYLAFYIFAGVTIGMALFDLDYMIRAPLYALLAATLQVINLIPNATGPLPRISGRVTWIVTILLLFYSAAYWLVGSVREAGGSWLLEVFLITPSLLVIVGVLGFEVSRKADTDKRHDEDPGE